LADILMMVRSTILIILLSAFAASAQPVTVQSRGPNGSSTSQVVRNVNGHSVPVNRVEDVIVSDSAGHRIIERTVRQFDANGNPGPPEKQRIEVRTSPDGTEETTTTVRRADINGNLQLAERRSEIARKSGDTVVTVERPTANGRFETVEKREQQNRELGAGRSTSSSTTWQVDSNGRLVEVTRRTAERNVSDGKAVENASEYESVSTGQMRLKRQLVTRSEGARTEVDIFEQPAGKAGAAPQLVRRQITEREARPDGAVDKISVQMASPNNPNQLGEVRKVEEVACLGDCSK
jgi:hypothetical protein